MNEPLNRVRWSDSPTAKAKSVVQRSVTALLNELAPEPIARRGSAVPARVEQIRLPTGCLLQAQAAALSVSWFPNRSNDASHGQLQVVLWRGIVSQRGATPNRKGATVVTELLLSPIIPVTEECIWEAGDGTQYGSAALAAKCTALLEEEIREPATVAQSD
jgi:hypothetical protein